MGLLDQPSIAEQIRDIKVKKYNKELKRENLYKSGAIPSRGYRRKRKVKPK